MTGAWVTVPPDRAAHLTDEARNFANEFVPDRDPVVARDQDEPPLAERDKPFTRPDGSKLR
jgi:hypothetical protein